MRKHIQSICNGDQSHARSENVLALNRQQSILKGVQIEVAVEVGELLLSLDEILELRPGDFFPLSFPDDSPIALRVAGEVVALGALVFRDGALQIVVTELT